MTTARETRSVCCYCGVGCGIIIESRDAQITGVRGDPSHPANLGTLCAKGATLHQTATHAVNQQLRALYPEARSNRSHERERCDWDTALNMATDRFAGIIREHGPDAVAFLLSGQLLTEDYYVFNKLAKGLIGTNNVDADSRLTVASAMMGYKQTLGVDAPPCCYDDIDHAEIIFIAGSNTAYGHPVLFQRISAAKSQNPNLTLIVADPRRTVTAQAADLHLPILPGTDVALFNGMLHILFWENLIDTQFIADHTEGFEALKSTVRDYTPQTVARLCGIRQDDLIRAACLFGKSKATLSLYGQGLNQSSSGTAKNIALINLHLATGQIGRKGAGPFSLIDQSNAMGVRETGVMTDMPSIPSSGKTTVEMLHAVESGKIKAIWIAGANPAFVLPAQHHVHKAFHNAELVVVQEAWKTTATTHYADILLPATSWGERDGTSTNSERCISRILPAVPAPGITRHDWDIAVDFARRLEARLHAGSPSLFPYNRAEEIWNAHRESTQGKDRDITGLSYALLEQQGPQQWPFPSGHTIGKKRLYVGGVFSTPAGRAKFGNITYKPVAEPVDARFPFALITGKLRDQWQDMSRTGTVAPLFSHSSEPCIEMCRDDAARRFLKEGELVKIISRRGSIILPVRISDELRSGQVFIAEHWDGELPDHGEDITHGINSLTLPALDPFSGQPELKHAAVKIQKAELGWNLLMFTRMTQQEALNIRQKIRLLRKPFAYSACVLFGSEDSGILFRAAALSPPDESFLDRLNELFGLGTENILRFRDSHKKTRSDILVENDCIKAVSLAGRDTSAGIWLKDYMMLKMSAKQLSQLLLIPGSQAPSGYLPQGKMVCSCFNLSETRISELFKEWGGTLESMVSRLRCELAGENNCISCLPEIRMIATNCPKSTY